MRGLQVLPSIAATSCRMQCDRFSENIGKKIHWNCRKNRHRRIHNAIEENWQRLHSNNSISTIDLNFIFPFSIYDIVDGIRLYKHGALCSALMLAYVTIVCIVRLQHFDLFCNALSFKFVHTRSVGFVDRWTSSRLYLNHQALVKLAHKKSYRFENEQSSECQLSARCCTVVKLMLMAPSTRVPVRIFL